jgi:hypothetical protein
MVEGERPRREDIFLILLFLSSSVMMTALASIERWLYCFLIATPYTIGVALGIRD